MSLEKTWVNPEGVKTDFVEGGAGLLQLSSRKEFSPDHILDLLICKTAIYEDCAISSRVLPLVVVMNEGIGTKKFFDAYSFDNKGVCLSHGYSRWEDGWKIVDEEHDTDVSRLKERGEDIRKMIEGYPVPFPLATHRTVMDLRDNCLRG